MSTVTKRVTTVNLEGSVKEVVFDREYPYFEVANMGSAPVYLSKYEDISAGNDGVYTVSAGSSIVANLNADTVYVSGSGVVQIAAKYEAEHSFKSSSKGGEGGGSAKAIIDNRRAVADLTDRGWTITERGNSSKNSDFDILCYKTTPGSLIYIVAEDNTLPCKFVWQNDSNVREMDPNPNLVAPPVTSAYKGVVTVPDNATWICFNVPKNDAVTGLYVMQQIVDISGELIVDTELSDTSPHPIANKTVAAAFYNKSETDRLLAEKQNISDMPTTLPANGGNADTVGNKSVSDIMKDVYTDYNAYLFDTHNSFTEYITNKLEEKRTTYGDAAQFIYFSNWYDNGVDLPIEFGDGFAMKGVDGSNLNFLYQYGNDHLYIGHMNTNTDEHPKWNEVTVVKKISVTVSLDPNGAAPVLGMTTGIIVNAACTSTYFTVCECSFGGINWRIKCVSETTGEPLTGSQTVDIWYI